MSYILDALKKSEQERKQGEVPGLNSFQDHPYPTRSASRMPIYLLLGILLVMTMTISLWLFFRQPPTPVPAEPAGEIIAETGLSQTGHAPQIEPKTLPITNKAKKDQPNQPAVTAKPDDPAPTPARAALIPESATDPDAVASPPTTAADDGDNEPAHHDDRQGSASTKPELITFTNLPPDIRSALPELVIAAHYYTSKPSSRMASINGRIMRQGQSVTDGLILEEITREGVILSFHDYRFSLEVFSL